jgi:hypothetical protein
MHTLRRILMYLASILLLTSMSASAQMQVPPHQPGTICFTQYFWCWAPRVGPPGTPCACLAPNGMLVPGWLG